MDNIEATLRQLCAAVHGADHVLIVTHNNPDPDAIACAVALRYLLEQNCQRTATIVYRGVIGRAENRALVRYLEYPLQRMTAADLRTSGPIALVDTQPGVGNHPVPATTNLAIVIDHHPWCELSSTARFSDVRPKVGAASTILVEYLRAAALTLTPQLATALFYGIKSDTLDLTRSATPADRDAFCFLLPQVDLEVAFKLEHAPLSPAYFKSLADTLQSAQVYNNVIVAHLGPMQYPDLTADMADLLLRMQDCRWVLCLGTYQDTLILSVRTRNKRGAGQLVRAIVGDRGTAGGHSSMAGGQIPLNGADPAPFVADLSRQFTQALRLVANPRGEPLL